MFKLVAKAVNKHGKEEKKEKDDDELIVMFYNEYNVDCKSCPFRGICGK